LYKSAALPTELRRQRRDSKPSGAGTPPSVSCPRIPHLTREPRDCSPWAFICSLLWWFRGRAFCLDLLASLGHVLLREQPRPELDLLRDLLPIQDLEGVLDGDGGTVGVLEGRVEETGLD